MLCSKEKLLPSQNITCLSKRPSLLHNSNTRKEVSEQNYLQHCWHCVNLIHVCPTYLTKPELFLSLRPGFKECEIFTWKVFQAVRNTMMHIN